MTNHVPQLAPAEAVGPGAHDHFTGAVQTGPIVENPPAKAYEVFFQPGARTVWHAHAGDQLLVALTGLCVVQITGEAARVLTPGQAVRIPAGVRHWHGAGSDRATSHLALNLFSSATDWAEPVTQQDYDKSVAHATATANV